MLDTSSPSASQPTPLSWLTNWVSQPMEMAPGFDVEEIKPSPAPPTIAPRNLLEVTVWDLYEPGKPYSFPVRVSEILTIEVPLLGELGVEHRTIPQVESALVDGYRKGEYLLHPRVIVRSLDAPVIKVQVTGAVNRPGYVELTRADRSAYAAIVSAGGLNKMAGTQVAVTRAAAVSLPVQSAEFQAERPDDGAVGPPAEQTPDGAEHDSQLESYEPHVPTQRANSVEDVSVPAAAPVVRPSPPGNRGLYSVYDNAYTGAGDTTPASPENQQLDVSRAILRSPKPVDSRIPEGPNRKPPSPTTWYDVSLARDRDLLQALLLGEGDTVTVKTAAQPLRIGGIVNRPGSYPLPPGRSLNAWQAIELAGGVRDDAVPLNITLSRPAAEGRGARRWVLNVASYEQHPPNSPLVEPGDELHVEPTTGSRIKRVVRDVWSKP